MPFQLFTTTSGSSADSTAALTSGIPTVESVPLLLNGGGTFDRQRNTVETLALGSAVRTATTNTPDCTNFNFRAIGFWLNVTANPGGAEALNLLFQIKEPVSSTYVTVHTWTAAITAANGVRFVAVGPGLPTSGYPANTQTNNFILTRTCRLQIGHSSTGNWTYTVTFVGMV